MGNNHDDDVGHLLILFSNDQPPAPSTDDARPFALKTSRSNRRTTSRARPGQAQFRFAVFKRYGAACAFCQITEQRLLEAAHLFPAERDGSDDPRNGLVMCLTRHKAFDLGILLVNPDSRGVQIGSSVPDLKTIGVSVTTIRHLKQSPHHDALVWVWDQWIQTQEPPSPPSRS